MSSAQTSFRIPFSRNAQCALETANEIATSRGHVHVGTEHLLYALCRCDDSRALTWIVDTCNEGDTNIDSAHIKQYIQEWLEDRPIWRQASDEAKTRPPHSPALTRVLDLAVQIGSRPVVDGSRKYPEGLVATEFLVGALLLEGTGMAVDALKRVSGGRVSYRRLFSALNLDVALLQPPSLKIEELNSFTIGTSPSSSREALPCVMDLLPNGAESFHTIQTLPPGPTITSNWLIPQRLVIGEHPSASEARALLRGARVNIFVSLIGEYSSSTYRKSGYVNSVENFLKDEPSFGAVQFLHFPISDFSVIKGSSLIPLVATLKRLLLDDDSNVVYLHCRGGHGRTGMVVIPLLCAIYDISAEEARRYVEWSTGTTREVDRRYGVHMPETDAQWKTVLEVLDIVRHHKRH